MSDRTPRYPFTSYPNGWYFIAETRDMKPGDERSGIVCGTRILFRMQSNGIIVLDNAMQCHEDNGLLYVFWGTQQKEVMRLPHFVELRDDGWMGPFNHVFKIRSHVQDITENTVDRAHMVNVHGYRSAPACHSFRIDGPHLVMSTEGPRTMFGITETIKMDITCYGVGLIETYVVSDHVTTKILITNTPIDEDTVRINLWFAIKKQGRLRDTIHRLLVPPLVHREFSYDLPIWENKIYRAQPILCAEEKDVANYRRWARQFFQEATVNEVAA